MKIAVFGAGYVGLVTAACLADLGNEVHCIDIDEEKIKKLKKGISHIYEPGLEEIIKRNIKEKRLIFDLDAKKAIRVSEIIFIAVGTPPKKDGEADLKYVKQIAKKIGENINSPKIIINKSTVPIGTGNLVSNIIKEHYRGNFSVVSNPEFLREGTAVFDFMNPDRIIIGNDDKKTEKKLLKLYESFNCPVILTDLKTAEMIKYASNTFLATSISFINSLALLCEKVGADVTKVSEGMKLDKRIGKHAFLSAGIGYGGSCFPKDVKALIKIGENVEHEFNLLKMVEEINKKQREIIIEKLKKIIPDLSFKTIGIWGLSFKPDTDDIREAPSITIVKELQNLGAKIKAFDPVAQESFKKLFNGIVYCQDPYKTAKDCHALIIATEWGEFKNLDFKKLKRALKSPNIIDGRNIYDPKNMRDLGFNYVSIGRN